MIDVTKLKPCGDKLLIKPDPLDETTRGGIIRPKTTVVDLQMASVVAVSDGFWGGNGDWIEIGKQFQVGDRVAYQHGVAAPVEDQPEYAYIQMAGILAREKREDE